MSVQSMCAQHPPVPGAEHLCGCSRWLPLSGLPVLAVSGTLPGLSDMLLKMLLICGAPDCCRGLKVLLVSLQCEGVGKDSIPGAINFDIINDMIQVTDKQSFLVSLPALHLS